MKKVILSSLMLFVAVMMSAATYSWQKVVEVKLTDGNNDTYTSRFGAAPELTDAASWGAVTANMEGATVLAYTTLGGTNYEQLYLNSIENLPLTIKTYNSTDLAIELKALYGEIKLYDNGNLVLTVAKGGVETDTYNCTVATGATIEGRFVINYVAAYNVKLNAYGYATFSADKEVSVPAGLTVWTGSNLGAEELSCEPLLGNIPANTGVLLWGDANAEFSLPIIANGNEDAIPNLFIPASEWANFGGQGLVLSGNMLYKYEGADFKANKAFLELPAGNPAPRRIRLVVDQATGVENVEATVKAEKFIENGQVLIKRGEAVYNLQGQIVK